MSVDIVQRILSGKVLTKEIVSENSAIALPWYPDISPGHFPRTFPPDEKLYIS